jgi:ubiquinone/menaquinone biosynthesis C-methylase UbiE
MAAACAGRSRSAYPGAWSPFVFSIVLLSGHFNGRGFVTSPSPQSQQPAVSLFSGAPSFGDTYEQQLVGPLFRPWAERLLDQSGLLPGERVLDVACGTGIVARLARQRVGAGTRVVAVDKSPVMLATARPLDQSIDWREGDALALPIGGDEVFDVIFCHQGLQFFSDKPAGVLGFHRALAPGGRLAAGVWRSAAENALFGEMDRVAERVLGPIHDARHSFGDEDALRRLLLDAGFRDVEVEVSTMETRFQIEPVVLARMNAMAVIGMSERGRSFNEQERAAAVAQIVEASLPEIARYAEKATLRFQTSANIATARK